MLCFGGLHCQENDLRTRDLSKDQYIIDIGSHDQNSSNTLTIKKLDLKIEIADRFYFNVHF
jgi:hypothetical protein